MGKSRDSRRHKVPKAKPKGPAEEEEDSEEEEQGVARGLGGQRSNVGMLPPSDSEDDDDKPADKPADKPEGSKAASKPDGGQSKTAGLMPPSDSDEEEEESESSDDEPVNEYLSAPRQPKKVVVEERDPDQIRKDLERLELIRKKREDDRLKRVATEGWDRFAPVSDTNRPPGSVPSDHPSQKS